MNVARLALALGIAAGGSFLAANANAIPILTFGQVGNVNTISGTENSPGLGVTTIAGSAAVTITQIAAAAPLSPFAAFLKLTMISTDAAVSIGPFIQQNYNGTFCVTAGLNCTGVNYLSGAVINGEFGAFGAGAQLTTNASTPPAGNVTFTSDVIASLGLERAAGFTFTNVRSLLHEVNGPGSETMGSFTSAIAGNFSADIPEPASLALLGMGLVGLGLVSRKRRSI